MKVAQLSGYAFKGYEVDIAFRRLCSLGACSCQEPADVPTQTAPEAGGLARSNMSASQTCPVDFVRFCSLLAYLKHVDVYLLEGALFTLFKQDPSYLRVPFDRCAAYPCGCLMGPIGFRSSTFGALPFAQTCW